VAAPRFDYGNLVSQHQKSPAARSSEFRAAGKVAPQLRLQPGCPTHSARSSSEQAVTLPEQTVQRQPAVTQARLVPCVAQASGVPSQELGFPPIHRQPSIALQV
jgi:hypothetical protein